MEASLPRPLVSDGATSGDIESLFRLRYREFLRVALAITGSREAAEDAVQEGLARALAGRRRFRRAGSLEAWVWQIVVNAARTARRQGRPPLEATTAHTEPADGTVRAAIAALPERQRLALFLRYYADLDYATIAAALGVARGTVSATLHQAHAALRRSLEPDE